MTDEKKIYIPDCSALWFLAEAILFNYLRFVSSRSLCIPWDTVARCLSFPLKKTFVCPLEDLSLLCLPGTGFEPSFVQWGDGLYSKIFFLLLLSGRIAEQDRRSPFWLLRIQCSRFLLFIEIYRNHLFFEFCLTGLQNRTGGFLSETGKSIFQAIFMIFSHYFMENSWNSVFYLTGLQDRTGGFLPAL